jgi:hypothetical protein
MAKAKTTTEETLVEETPVEETLVEETPVEETVAPIILNEPAPAREDSGYGSRDFHTTINQG